LDITKKSSDLGLGGLLIMIAFLVLTVMLLVYYVGRLITLYIGAVLSPIVMLLYLIPAFKDFAITALKTYLMTIFVLFVQVVIMQLASSIFSGMLQNDTSGQPNTLMALIVGLATVLALLKTQGVMQELSHAASTPRAARETAGAFMRGVSYLSSKRRRRRPDEDEDDQSDDSKKKKRKKRLPDNGYGSESDQQDSINSSNNRRPARNRPESHLQTGETERAQVRPETKVETKTPRKPKKEIKT